MRYILLAFFLSNSLCLAQQGGGAGGGGAGGGGAGGGQAGGQFPGGILINPGGVISSPVARRISPALEQKRLKLLAQQNLPATMVNATPLRKVSLVRIELACRKAVEAGTQIPDHVRYLGGLTQIHYLIAVPEQNDLLLAGPAEGFAPLQDGRVVGTETGRPVLTLDDLLVMLRLPNIHTQLGCSFDPEPARLAHAQAWTQANTAPASAAAARQRFVNLSRVLGNWNISVFGLPPTSHAAITAVEADYELKRLTLGLIRPTIRGFRSYLDMATPGGNTMRRWWFAPHYDVIEQTVDRTTFHISGPRLQLLAQEELVDVNGNREDAAFTAVSTEKYTRLFNKHIDALCQRIPSLAAVQNVFDLAVVAALIRSEDLPQRVGWTPSVFLDADALPLREYSVPTEVPSMVNAKSANRGLMIALIGGGVTITPSRIIKRMDEMATEDVPDVSGLGETDNHWWD